MFCPVDPKLVEPNTFLFAFSALGLPPRPNPLPNALELPNTAPDPVVVVGAALCPNRPPLQKVRIYII